MHIHIPGTGMISQQFMLDISLCQCTFISQALGWLVSNTCSTYHCANAHVFPASYHHVPATVMNSWHSMLDISLWQCTFISQTMGWLVRNTCSIYHCANAHSYPRHWDDWSAIHAPYIAVTMHIHIPGTGMISQHYMLDISLWQCTVIS
jgi:hypothetical protein